MTNGEMLAIMNAINDIKVEVSALRVEMRDGYRELKVEILELREDVQVLKEDVPVLKEEVRVLKEDVQVLKEEVRVLKEDVQVLKGEVSGLNEKFETQNAFIQHGIMPILNDHAAEIVRLSQGQRELTARMDVMEESRQAVR